LQYGPALSGLSHHQRPDSTGPERRWPGDAEFVATVMDITERRRAEEALRSAPELARVARLTRMGELVASPYL
jgi:hypothetical protein